MFDKCYNSSEEKKLVSKYSLLFEQNHSLLYQMLAKHSSMWKEIGTYLGFLPSELQDIQARPLLLYMQCSQELA